MEREPARLKHLHQQIWTDATVRLGHNSEGAYFNQRHASFLTSFQALTVYCCAWKEAHRKIGFGVAKAPWDRLIWYTHQWKCLLSWMGWYWLLVIERRTGTDTINNREVRLDSSMFKVKSDIICHRLVVINDEGEITEGWEASGC